MRPQGSVAAVVAAIREDAAAEAEAVERDEQAALARIAAEAEVGAAPGRADRSGAVAAARERARAQSAQEDWEDSSAAMADRERWMADATALGRQLLLEAEPPARRRDRLARLAREGRAKLPAGPIEIVVAAADAALLDADWRAAIAAPADADSVRVVAGAMAGGCLIRTADGRASVDNSYAARAERLQTTWRAELGRIYERATQGLTPGAPDGPST